MKVRTIMTHTGGHNPRPVPLNEITIPDAWHSAMRAFDLGLVDDRDLILEVWHLAHDLLWNLKNLESLETSEG